MTTQQRPFTKIDNCILEYVPLMKGNTLKVYLVLASRVNHRRKDNKVWPSYNSLMKDTGIKDRHAISTAIKELEDLRLIEIERELRHSNIYKVCYPEYLMRKSTLASVEHRTRASGENRTLTRVNNKNNGTRISNKNNDFLSENSSSENWDDEIWQSISDDEDDE